MSYAILSLSLIYPLPGKPYMHALVTTTLLVHTGPTMFAMIDQNAAKYSHYTS